MKGLFIFFVHLITTIAQLLGPGGARSVVADSLLMKQQLLVIDRSRQRAPNPSTRDRFLLGVLSFFVHPRRISRSAVIIKPSTLLRCHDALVKCKYQWLYSSQNKRKPGPKGPSPELTKAIVEMKRRNPKYGCPRIAQQINRAFGTNIDKDVVRLILAKHYHPESDPDDGPSWLTFIGHLKDSLWSVDLFRSESILLKSHWVLVTMDQYTRRIIGFGVHAGDVDGVVLFRLFNKAISKMGQPKYLSTDNDPRYRYHRWKANLRILDVDEIKSVSHVPRSHPFVERLIGTVRRECLDQTLFWNARDLERKLIDFQTYYNRHRAHRSLGCVTPAEFSESGQNPPISLNDFRWQSHCRGLYQLPAAA